MSVRRSTFVGRSLRVAAARARERGQLPAKEDISLAEATEARALRNET